MALAALCGCAVALDAAGQGSTAPSQTSLRVELGRSAPATSPVLPVRLSLRGATADQDDVQRRSDNRFERGAFAGIGLEWAFSRGSAHHLDLSLDFVRHAGRQRTFDATFAEQKMSADGLTRVAAMESVSGQTFVRGSALVASLRLEGGGHRSASAAPWASLGVGLARIDVQGFTAHFDARMRLQGPGYEIDDRLTHGQLWIRRATFHGVAWQASAGLAWELARGQVLRLGLRYADQGRYRLTAQPSEWHLEAQGETLRAVLASVPSRLATRDLLVSLAQAF
jgi:hypothetical protein